MKRKRRDGGSGMSSLGDLIAPALKRMGIHGAIRDAQIEDVFAEVVGPALSGHCRALRIEHGALVVACANSALSQQLHMEATKIIDQVNQKMGAELVKRMRFSSR
jgi:hypothetical protein